MDPMQAFAEYGRILREAEEWLAGGYRGLSEETPVVPPPPPAAPETNPHPPNAPGTGPEPHPPNAAGAGSVPHPPNAQGTGPEPHPPNAQGTGPEPHPPNAAGAGSEPHPPNAPGNASDLREIANEIRECRRCELNLIRNNTVPGIGSRGAQLMIVTPAPAGSAGEDESPLAPSENEYLGKWLAALELLPERDVFITPAVKCRTPAGRPPYAGEAAACRGFLHRQYRAAAPKALLALGESACGALCGNSGDFPRLVGREWSWGGVPALVLWTPAEVLANPGELRKPVWEALKRLKAAWNALPGSRL